MPKEFPGGAAAAIKGLVRRMRGRRLLPQRELAQQHGISRQRLRTVLDDLERRGLVARRQGSSRYALAIANFAPRPVLLLNAKNDATVLPEMADRFFAAAKEPKEQRWYDSGHLLPTKAYDDAAKWIARTWASLADTSPQ